MEIVGHQKLLINVSVNCEWSSWNIDACSTTCGPGTQAKSRYKTVNEVYGGTCTGDFNIVGSCNIIECPGDIF